MIKVLIIFGGNSSEHYISCLSTYSILQNIDRNIFEVTSVGISKENEWFLFKDKIDLLKTNNWLEKSLNNKINNIVTFIKRFDVIFPIIHGKYGEDGKLQGFLEILSVPYVGCNSLSSGIGMDKEITKIILNSENIPQVPYCVLNKNYTDLVNILNRFDFPMIVKPASGGSSIGINKANNQDELLKALKEASKYDSKIIVEPFLKIRELECAIIEDNHIIVSNIGEIIPSNEFYDYNAKYENDKSNVIVPANIDKTIENKIKNYAKKAFLRLGASGLSRVDFFYDEINDKIYLNEINTMPGFTDISMYPKLIMNNGYSYKEIITLLINNALEKDYDL